VSWLERVLLADASGVLPVVVGVLLLGAPVGALATLTLLLACFLMAGGTFKIVAAVGYRFAAWGWSMASGIIDVILGVLISHEWPASAPWAIGVFVGIDVLFRGFNWISLGLALRSLPPPADGLQSTFKLRHDRAERSVRGLTNSRRGKLRS
jgi:uncharacterized membrane protein HdeD (DUF308 family)